MIMSPVQHIFIVFYLISSDQIIFNYAVELSVKSTLESLPAESRIRVVGGSIARAHSHPYQVSLQTKLLWMNFHICGGSILTPTWVITAGHCVNSFPISWLPMDVVAGIHNLAYTDITKIQIGKAATFVVHPDYNGDIGPNDIGLVNLQNPFWFTKEVQPIRLPQTNSTPIGPTTLTGWGSTSNGYWPDFPEYLHVIELPILSFEKCSEAVRIISGGEDIPIDERSNICTGPLDGGFAACSGDSGGPLVQYGVDQSSMESSTTDSTTLATASNDEGNADKSNNTASTATHLEGMKQHQNKANAMPTLVGIVSWGMIPCGSSGAPSVYTKVSSFMDFIGQYVYEYIQ